MAAGDATPADDVGAQPKPSRRARDPWPNLAAAGTLAFVVLSAAFVNGWLVGFDEAADAVLREPWGEWSRPGGTYEYVVIRPARQALEPSGDANGTDGGGAGDGNGTVRFSSGDYDDGPTGAYVCQRADTLDRRPARYDDYGADRTVYCDGNFTIQTLPGGYWVDPPWGGYASDLGSEGAALALLAAATLLFVALGQWRTAVVVVAVGALGGSLVDPMKEFFAPYGEVHYGAYPYLPDRYPSGHTIGGTLQFGLLLVLGAVALARAGLTRDPALLRKACVAWAIVAAAVGVDRVVVHAHIASDVLAGWAFGAALVAAAVWIDREWNARSRTAPVAVPEASP